MCIRDSAYLGDGNNIVNSWLQLGIRLPLHFVCCSPEGYEPDAKTIKRLEDSGLSSFELSQEPYSAVKNSDVIYTDVWASMGQEEEHLKRKKIFENYRVYQKLIELADEGAIILHCLPAHRGEEITEEALESKSSNVFDQAENRLHVQQALLAVQLGGL